MPDDAVRDQRFHPCGRGSMPLTNADLNGARSLRMPPCGHECLALIGDVMFFRQSVCFSPRTQERSSAGRRHQGIGRSDSFLLFRIHCRNAQVRRGGVSSTSREPKQ